MAFTNGSHRLSPGLYSKIQISGTARVTLAAGVYVIAEGGLSADGQASLSGTGVLIYLAGGRCSGSGGGGFSLAGGASVDISPPATGSYAGVAIFQARGNKSDDTETARAH